MTETGLHRPEAAGPRQATNSPQGQFVSGLGIGAADLCAALFAVDPVGLGGVCVRSGPGPARDRWLATLAALLPTAAPWRRVPLHAKDDRLFGGLDIAATLQAGRPVAQRGLLAEADGGAVVLAMAERLGAAAAARIAVVLDAQAVVAERHGVGLRADCRIGVVALDEGLDDDEQVPAVLRERLAFRLQLSSATPASVEPPALFSHEDIAAARVRYGAVQVDAAIVEGLCAAALALGVDSLRAALFACRAARAAAALDGRSAVNDDDAALAAALVLAPRATRVPQADGASHRADDVDDPDRGNTDGAAQAASAAPRPADADPDPAPHPATGTATHADAPDDGGSEPSAGEAPPAQPGDDAANDPPACARVGLDDAVLEAALAAIPPGLLASLALGHAPRRAGAGGRVGAARPGMAHGRPIGANRGEPRGGARLNLIETLRAAAPWQSLRRSEGQADGSSSAMPTTGSPATGSPTAPSPPTRSLPIGAIPHSAATEPSDPPRPPHTRIHVRREDFRIWRNRQRSETTTIFVVDASGSAALHRLAEAKGAVELLLADCYVRRDQVAMIAFRGAAAEVLLPPTRSLVRAKRSLAALPGGGGTPLAAGIDAAQLLADVVRRRGGTPIVVLLTDGRANIARDGTPGRTQAGADAVAAAQRLRADAVAVLLLDTSPQPQAQARELGTAMGARYLPLPHADAARLSQAVRAAGVA